MRKRFQIAYLFNPKDNMASVGICRLVSLPPALLVTGRFILFRCPLRSAPIFVRNVILMSLQWLLNLAFRGEFRHNFR